MSSDECCSIYGKWEYNENVTKDNPIPVEQSDNDLHLTSTVGGNFNH